MGNQAVVNVQLDSLHVIAEDPEFGANLRRAILHKTSGRGDPTVTASTPSGGVRIGAAQVISWDHASGFQVVVCHGNTGWRVCPWKGADPLPPDVEQALIAQVKQLGYQVYKSKAQP